LIRNLAVIVPAANEEQTIAACLASITAARRHLARSRTAVVQVEVFVVLDRCQDETAAVAARFPGVRPVIVSAGRVGAARHAGTRAAIGSAPPACELWLANTDADCVVPRDWLSFMVAEARRDAHVVLGTVLPGPGLPAAVRAAWLSRHHLRDNHPHIHGANFGIRADAYMALGGWQPLALGEDVDLAGRAASAGHLRVSRTASIPVITSSRPAARVPGGFASYLSSLSAPASYPAADLCPAWLNTSQRRGTRIRTADAL
jgi:glycosyltransferase involved in cell wall biosynthesis